MDVSPYALAMAVVRCLKSCWSMFEDEVFLSKPGKVFRIVLFLFGGGLGRKNVNSTLWRLSRSNLN